MSGTKCGLLRYMKCYAFGCFTCHVQYPVTWIFFFLNYIWHLSIEVKQRNNKQNHFRGNNGVWTRLFCPCYYLYSFQFKCCLNIVHFDMKCTIPFLSRNVIHFFLTLFAYFSLFVLWFFNAIEFLINGFFLLESRIATTICSQRSDWTQCSIWKMAKQKSQCVFVLGPSNRKICNSTVNLHIEFRVRFDSMWRYFASGCFYIVCNSHSFIFFKLFFLSLTFDKNGNGFFVPAQA